MPITQPSSTSAPLTQRPAWVELAEHCKKLSGLQLRQLLAEHSKRAERFTMDAVGLAVDYSKHRITAETVLLLLELAERSGRRQHIDAMFAGEKINVTEHRAALPVALHAPKGEPIFVDGVDVVHAVHAVLDKMAALPNKCVAAFGKATPACPSGM